jgi:hypothetical protein
MMKYLFIILFNFLFVLVVLVFELRASNLVQKCSVTSTTPVAFHYFPDILPMPVSNCHLLISTSCYRCVPPHLALLFIFFFLFFLLLDGTGV